MKTYCNMIGNYCRDVMIINDAMFIIDECIHPDLLPLYKNNLVPNYVQPGWTRQDDGVWVDMAGVRWPEGIPEGPTPFDPNYIGPWPVPAEEEPEIPEEQSE